MKTRLVVLMFGFYFLNTIGSSRTLHDTEPSIIHIHAHVLAKQLSAYDMGIVSDGPAWQTVLVQTILTRPGEKLRPEGLAIIRYEFYPPDDALPDRINDYKATWEFDAVRTASCDQTLKQLYYGAVDKKPDPQKSVNLLRVNRGAEKLIPKKSSAALPCFLVKPGTFTGKFRLISE